MLPVFLCGGLAAGRGGMCSAVSSAFLGKSERDLVNQEVWPTGQLFYVPQVTTKFECGKYQPISLNRLKKEFHIEKQMKDW